MSSSGTGQALDRPGSHQSCQAKGCGELAAEDLRFCCSKELHRRHKALDDATDAPASNLFGPLVAEPSARPSTVGIGRAPWQL